VSAIGLPGSVSLSLSLGLGHFAPDSLLFSAPGFDFCLPSFLRTALAFLICAVGNLPPVHKALAPGPAGFERGVVVREFLPAGRTANGYEVLRTHGLFEVSINDGFRAIARPTYASRRRQGPGRQDKWDSRIKKDGHFW
jgi:hypothetical protein